MRYSTVHKCPARAAFINGVRPPSDLCSMSAPCSMSTSTTSVWPFSAAYVNAESAVAVVAFTLAPSENKFVYWIGSNCFYKP